MNELLWFVGRGTGVVAFVALSLTLLLGILTRSGRDLAGLGRYGLHELHRTTALTAIALLAAHVGTLVLDPVSGVAAAGAAVPFTSTYAPAWVGLGTVATYLIAVGALTGYLRSRLTPRGFSVLHAVGYAAWPLAALHFLGAGTDGRSSWALSLVAACTLPLLLAIAWRLTDGVASRGHRRLPRRVPPARPRITTRS